MWIVTKKFHFKNPKTPLKTISEWGFNVIGLAPEFALKCYDSYWTNSVAIFAKIMNENIQVLVKMVDINISKSSSQ